MASFKKMKTGWQYRISFKDGDKYRTKSENGFSTKKEAQLAAAKYEKLLHGGAKISNEVVFVDYMQQWYELYKKDKFSPSYNHDAEIAIRFAKEFFKDTKLKDINKNLYQQYLNWLGDGRSTGTVKKRHMYTNECLKDALGEGLIFSDPARKVTIKGSVAPKDKSTKYLNYGDAMKVIDELKKGIKPQWASRYMILLGMATGMRFSEVLGLSWEDINFDEMTISINKAFDHVVSKQLHPPKSVSSNRVITIDAQTVRMLKEYKLAHQKNKSKYVFLDPYFDHISNNAVNKALKKACRRVGVKEITFHSLRHTHCSILIYEGVNIKYISKRLGHATTGITYEIYGHILDELEQKESQRVNTIMDDLFNVRRMQN